jgi:hypothetical protein
MDSQPAKTEPTPFQRFDALARRVMSVPKAEVDRRTAEAKKSRDAARQAKHQ